MEYCGVLTIQTLMMFSNYSNISRVTVLKRAAILFDQILLPNPPGLGPINRQQFLTSIGNPNTTYIDSTTRTSSYYKLFLDVNDIIENSNVFRIKSHIGRLFLSAAGLLCKTQKPQQKFLTQQSLQ